MKTLAVRQRRIRRNKKSARRSRLSQLERLETRQLLAGDISGTVYNDVDANGIRNQDDIALTNWTVFLDLNQNGNLDAGEPSELTDADGKYRFRGIDAGDYRVTEVLRSDWTAINPAWGFVDVTVVDGENARADFFNNGGGGTATITGNVWRDLNNDGIQDPGDTGVAGWTLYLDLNGDRILDPDEPVEFTDGDGNYTFSNILGGGVGDAIDYEVVEILTPGWEATAKHSEDYTVSVIEGEITTVPDFANTPIDASRVEGTIYNDANGNGLRDAGEPGLSSWTVYADLNTNNVLDAGEPSDITDTQGRYSLIALEPGTHRISVIQPINFQPISPAAGYQSAVAPSQDTVSNVNFGFKERTDAAIGGVVYVDRNHDGVRDPGEEGLAGITVYIDDNNNGVLDPGEPSVQTSDDRFYTPDVDEAGTYRFESLAAGTYHIRQIIPETLSSTPELEREHSVTVGPTDDRSDVDCGDRYRPSEIHGFKFEDVNGNALRDAGEPGIAGVTIYIDLNRNNLLDPGEPTTLTAVDGSYSFDGLETDSYVIRELVPAGFVQTFPTTKDGILWPEGTSNPPIGNVTPSLIEASLSDGETLTETVSLTLPTTGALTNMVDVFLLFDDTGSFTSNSPIVRAAFPNIISQLQTRLTGIDLGFGVGRLEEYGNFASEYAQGRPFTLNQPIVAADVPGFEASIQAALDHVAPGYGGDRPETVIEALYQMVTGAGFDGNDNGSVLDSGAAGTLSTQTSPGSSGDVPSFDSFTADPANGILPASGTIGGAGFRSGALPIIITATDTGFAYQPKGDDTIVGIDGLTIPRSQVVSTGRATTPFSSGAGVQETVTGLNALGALVIGLGTNDAASADPRQGLESLASLTGAINRTANPIDNGTPDTIAPGDPLYFKIGSGGDPLVGNIADGIVAAIEGAVTSVNVNVTLRASDPRVHIDFAPGVLNGLGAGDTATFDVTFTGDGRPHRFDLQFVREGTDVVLGSIPIVLGTPISGDGYEFEDCDDGEITSGTDFGNQRIDGFIPNVAPSFTVGANQAVLEDAGAQSISAWATNIVSGPAGEPAQNIDFIVSNDNNALFAVQPTLAADGTLSFTPADNAFGTANVTVQLHDDGGTAGGGSDTSVPQVFVINVAPVNDAPGFTAGTDVTVDQDAPTQTIANWATALSSGPANESTQTLGFIITNNNNALFSGQPAITSDGTLTFTPAAGMMGYATVSVTVVDDGGTANGGFDSGVPQTFQIHVVSPPKPEDSAFFVVDYTRDRVFQYDTNGELLDSARLDKEDQRPRGIATAPDGSTSWVINKDGEVFIYDAHQRTLGFWKAAGIDKPQGITVHGDNLWIVDAEAKQVLLYVGGASTREGEWTPTSRFDLSSENQHPTDLVTNGDSIWVLDDARRNEKVYRYAIDGVPKGSWSLDPQQRNPTGITLDHQDPNDFWIVDANTDAVYHYDQATARVDGQQAADLSFPLARRNGNPQGISSRGLAIPAATLPVDSPAASFLAPPPPSYDVNADGTVSIRDALFVINHLEEQAEGELPDFAYDLRLDVNGDGHVSAADALAIVNQLASRFSDASILDLALADDTEDYLSDLELSTKDLLGSF